MKINNLKYLLSPWIKNIPEINILNIVSDSRKSRQGDLFIAVKGMKKDGRDFIHEAVKNKVSAILFETQIKNEHGKFHYINDIPLIFFFKLSKFLSDLSGRFYYQPGKKLKIIGVTGTNGKTTVTQLIAQWSEMLGNKTAIMGTLGNGLYNLLKPTKNTTSCPIFIQSFLYATLKKKTQLVAMEVSSHGLIQNRVKNVPFNIAIFTNLTQDHLDFHENMKKYEQAKWLFFTTHNVKKMIINANDKYGKSWLKQLCNHYTISVTIQDSTQKKHSTKWINATKIRFYCNLTIIKFESSWGNSEFSSTLIGCFNVMNLLLSLACLLELGYKLSDLIQVSHQLRSAPGRMEKFKLIGKPTLIIDYAHTPDALKKALNTIRIHYKKKIWCIFGCGGERDKKKRSLMGSIAEKIADKVIITNDNPRKEKEQTIIQDILKGCKNKKSILIIKNREKAISYAFHKAQHDDIIFIAGKGNENRQIIGNQYICYSDKNTVSYLLKEKKND